MRRLWIMIVISSCMTYAFPELRITVEDVSISRGGENTKGFFEGDIKLPKYRSAIRDPNLKWPNGEVPYTISSAYSSTMLTIIANAMREIESNTKNGTTNCVTFVNRTTQADYVNIQQNSGCGSHVGRIGGAQELSLGTDCESKGTVMHELIHALGFWHEQNRYDRDIYVTVHTDNIAVANERDFEKRTNADMDLLETTYDLGSIMHYDAYKFAIDKSRPALIPNSASSAAGVEMGQRAAMSILDVERIQKLYGCTVDTTHITTPFLQSIVHCSFDTNLCNLQQDTQDDFDWIGQVPGTPTSGTRPDADHTNGVGKPKATHKGYTTSGTRPDADHTNGVGKPKATHKVTHKVTHKGYTTRTQREVLLCWIKQLVYQGSYIYAEVNEHHGQKARLLTPTAVGGQYCVIFWIFQHGSQEGAFDILAWGPRIPEQTLYTIPGNQAFEWKQYRINLTVPASFRLIFQARIGAGDSSDIAIDDFAMYQGQCM